MRPRAGGPGDFREREKGRTPEMTDQADACEEAPEEDAVESPLVDLTGLTLTDLAELPHTVLGEALRSIMESAQNPDDVFTAEHKEAHSRR